MNHCIFVHTIFFALIFTEHISYFNFYVHFIYMHKIAVLSFTKVLYRITLKVSKNFNVSQKNSQHLIEKNCFSKKKALNHDEGYLRDGVFSNQFHNYGSTISFVFFFDSVKHQSLVFGSF